MVSFLTGVPTIEDQEAPSSTRRPAIVHQNTTVLCSSSIESKVAQVERGRGSLLSSVRLEAPRIKVEHMLTDETRRVVEGPSRPIEPTLQDADGDA